jgi:hypothetical protein
MFPPHRVAKHDDAPAMRGIHAGTSAPTPVPDSRGLGRVKVPVRAGGQTCRMPSVRKLPSEGVDWRLPWPDPTAKIPARASKSGSYVDADPGVSRAAGSHSSTTIQWPSSRTGRTTRPCHPDTVSRHSSSRPGSRPCSSVTQHGRIGRSRSGGAEAGSDGDSESGGAPWMRSWRERRSPRRFMPPATPEDIEHLFDDWARPATRFGGSRSRGARRKGRGPGAAEGTLAESRSARRRIAVGTRVYS